MSLKLKINAYLKLKENQERIMAKTSKTRVKKDVIKLSDEDRVSAYMEALDHPLKKEIEALRMIIQNANNKIRERIKWNAPSYYYKDDLVTFNPRSTKTVHLVFHHPAIVKIKSDLLEGSYKDRRMAYFDDMKSVKASQKELERIINELVKLTG